MNRIICIVLFMLGLVDLAWAENNPLVGMWMLQESEGKVSQADPMGAALGMLSPRIITFTEKSMEVNGQLQRVEYEISGNDVIVWVDKVGSRFVVTGNTMKMLVPNPMTGKTSEVLYVHTTKEQMELEAKRAEELAKARLAQKAKAAQKEAESQRQARIAEEKAQAAAVAPPPVPTAPKPPDLRYLVELPDPQKVLADISGKDGMDTVARQVGAFETLAKVVKIRSEGRVYRNALTPDEGAKYRGYLDNQQRLIAEQNAKFDLNCQGTQCDRPTFFRLYDQYGLSKEFRQEVFDRFLSKQWQELHRPFEAKQ